MFGRLAITAVAGVPGSGTASVGGKIEIYRDPAYQPGPVGFLFVTAPNAVGLTAVASAFNAITLLPDTGWIDGGGVFRQIQGVTALFVPGVGFTLRVDIW